MLDTGAARTLVREDFLQPDYQKQGEVTIRCAHGDSITYPLADVRVSVGKERFAVRAAVSKTLPASVLLGRDNPGLMALLGLTTGKEKNEDSSLVLADTTRARSKAQEEEEKRIEEWNRTSGASPTSLQSHDENDPHTDPLGMEFNFDPSLFSGKREKTKLPRSERRRNNREHWLQKGTTPNDAVCPPGVSAIELQRLQAEDSTLDAVRKTARGESKAGRRYFMKNSIAVTYHPAAQRRTRSVGQLSSLFSRSSAEMLCFGWHTIYH